MKKSIGFLLALVLILGAALPAGAFAEDAELKPVSPQRPGAYENAGLRLELKPEYDELVTVETPADDENGVLFTVSETASLEAGGFAGAGWLFSVAKIDAEKLHRMLCHDMVGAELFAKGADGSCYVKYHPTDVRYARATVEEMHRDAEQWTMLCEGVDEALESFTAINGLEYAAIGNTEVDMYLARAAWEEGAKPTLSTTEFGPVDAAAADGTPYAEFVMQSRFRDAEAEETPDGEYVVLAFPEENVRLDFFFAPGGYVRIVSGTDERLYQAMRHDDGVSCAEAMQGWYYAAAEKAGVKTAEDRLAAFCGSWAEKVAGRGRLTVTPSLAPGKARIEAAWPESAAVQDTWEMTATLSEDGKLVYESGLFTSTAYGEGGEGRELESDRSISGQLSLNENGELLWEDSRLENPDSVFVRA